MNTEQRNTRAEQSRINGAKSRGAKTEAGQAKAKTGNFKHGAYAAHTTVVPMESMEGYETLLADAKVQFQPRTLFEAQIVDEIVDLTWQIGRLKFLVTAQVNAAMIERSRKVAGPSRIDEDMLAAETAGATATGPITILERRIKTYFTLRSKLMADLDRLKKIPLPPGPSREFKITKDYSNTFEFQYSPEFVQNPPNPAPMPPHSASAPDPAPAGGQM